MKCYHGTLLQSFCVHQDPAHNLRGNLNISVYPAMLPTGMPAGLAGFAPDVYYGKSYHPAVNAWHYLTKAIPNTENCRCPRNTGLVNPRTQHGVKFTPLTGSKRVHAIYSGTRKSLVPSIMSFKICNFRAF